jgi:LysM repeat protein
LADKQIRRAGVVVLLSLVLGGILFAAGCSSSKSNMFTPHTTRSQGTYTVRRGDTLHHIAQRYGVSVSSLMNANRINEARELQVGQVLTIPGYTSYAAIDNYGSDSSVRVAG